ncbi:MAG: hypothetical protein V1779_09105 [bacterium]
MKSSNLYKIHENEKVLQALKEIEFSEFSFKERYDIQEWVESTPEILGEELLIIGKEFSQFDKTKERPDLIAIDSDSNIVIIELKRDDSGTSVEWQAIKYASYFSKFTLNDILNTFFTYKNKSNKISKENISNLEQEILEFIEKETLHDLNKKQRIILVSHRFAKEVTSAVNWLINNYNMDIKCVQLIPYYDVDIKTFYIESNTILPLPGLDEIIIRAGGNNSHLKNLTGPVKKDDEVTDFFNNINEDLKNSKIDNKLIPDKISRWAGVSNTFRYFHFWYSDELWANWDLSYKIWLYNELEKDVNRKNKFGIYFMVNKKHLLLNAIPESLIKEIEEYLKNQKIGYKYVTDKNNIYIEKIIENKSLSNDTKELILNELLKLIRSTKKDFDEIIKKNKLSVSV